LYFGSGEIFANKTRHFGKKLGREPNLLVGANARRVLVYDDLPRRRWAEFCKSESGCFQEAGQKQFGDGAWQAVTFFH
jgi:hypothetical protein